MSLNFSRTWSFPSAITMIPGKRPQGPPPIRVSIVNNDIKVCFGDTLVLQSSNCDLVFTDANGNIQMTSRTGIPRFEKSENGDISLIFSKYACYTKSATGELVMVYEDGSCYTRSVDGVIKMEYADGSAQYHLDLE